MKSVLMVVPTMGRRNAWLRTAVTSAQGQSLGGVDVVVVGPSGSSAAEVAHDLGAHYVVFDPPGMSAAINEAWTTMGTDYEYLAWLGDDDVLAPASLRASVSHLDRHPRCVAVYGRIRAIRADGSTIGVARPGRLARHVVRFSVNHVPQPGAVFRAEAVRRVGYLDEALTYAMDQDLFLRLRKIGTLDYLPIELAAIRVHGDTITAARVDGGQEESVVRARHLSGVAVRRCARYAPALEVAGRVYSSIIRRMPAPPPPTVAGLEYVRAGTGTSEGDGPGADATAVSRSRRPQWRVVAVAVESLVVGGCARVWDATVGEWDRRRLIGRDALHSGDGREL